MIKQVHIEGLDVLSVVKEKLSTANEKIAVVMLHGYGANMHDLFPLWQHLDFEEFDWYFPNGLLTLNSFGGRCWFPIDEEALEKAMREGRFREFRTIEPQGFSEAIGRLEIFLKALSRQYQNIILGGFSQGAMISSHLLLSDDVELHGLILLSGVLVNEKNFENQSDVKIEKLRNLAFYQSHGVADPLLSLQGAKELESQLKSFEMRGDLETFQGQHEIPLHIIQSVRSFLSLKRKASSG